MSNKIGTLKHGLKIGDKVHKSFEIRTATSGDLYKGEQVATQERPLTFRSAVLCEQLVSIGEFTGPFTLSILSQLRPRDLNVMLEAQDELDKEGEDSQPD